jgi:hypothetical protein
VVRVPGYGTEMYCVSCEVRTEVIYVMYEKVDPSFRQRRHDKITNSNCLKENLKEKEKLVAGPRWVPNTKTDWPTDCQP